MNTPILILEASKQKSLNIPNIEHYLHLSKHDALLRKDYLNKYDKLMKSGKTWKEFIELVETKQIDLVKINTPKKVTKEDTDNQISLF